MASAMYEAPKKSDRNYSMRKKKWKIRSEIATHFGELKGKEGNPELHVHE